MSDFEDLDDFEDFDSDDDFDDSGFDDEADDPQREAKIAAFQDRVTKAMRVLSSSKAPPDARRTAAEWLGESGEPKAITALRQAWKNDPDKKVQQAAEYSLGMFRALEEAFNDPERADEVGELLEKIIFEGAIGGSSSLKRILRPLQILLTITFVIILILGLVLGSGALTGGGGVPTLIPTATEFISPTPIATIAPLSVLEDIRAYHANLVGDSNLLASRFQNVIRNQSQECETTVFIEPPEYTIPEGFDAAGNQGLDDVISRLNNARTELEALRQPYDSSCESTVPITIADANTHWDQLVILQGTLNTTIQSLLNDPNLVPGVVVPTLTPAPTATALPTPTLEPAVIQRHVRELQFRVDQMNQLINGHNNRLIQFWADLELAGQTDGCRDGIPELPLDYIIPQEDLIVLPQDLQDAIASYNLAMSLSRESWTLFDTDCSAGTLGANLQQGKLKAEAAKGSFDGADTLIAALQN